MKNQEFQFSLIDNTFTAEEAREVIISLMNAKIRFLNVQILSIHERFGSDGTHLEKRINQLEADRKNLITVLSDYATQNVEISVSCDVKLVAKQTTALHAK